MHPFPSSLAAALLLLVGRGAPAAGWDSIPHDPASPVHDEGALVLHDDGTAVRAFSATTRRFAAVADTGSEVLGTGDWIALVREGTDHLAYSARRNTVTALGVSGTVIDVRVEDDVAVVVASKAGQVRAWAYSAFTGTVDDVKYTADAGLADDLATSRFVAVLRTATGVFGFAARHGVWTPLAEQNADAPAADGNVGLVELPSPTGADSARAAAFSGVTGAWAVSPVAHADSTLIDHDVAFARGFGGVSTWFALGYSAYNGQWVSSSVSRPMTLGGLPRVSDNVVAIQAIPPSPGLEAFGARPGLQWAVHQPEVVLFVPLGEDYLHARDLTDPKAFSFSGICDGTFTETSFTGPAFSATVAPDHVSVASDSAITVRAYSPLTNAWTPFPGGGALGPYFDDAIVLGLDPSGGGAQRWRAFAPRHGHWTEGPVAAGAATTFVGGSYGGILRTSGASAGDLWLYDERCDQWQAHALGAAADRTLGRNVLLLELQTASKEVLAWSVQRGALEPSGGAAGPPAVAPAAEENVGWYVDAVGTLHAFGAHGDLHVWAQHPNGTEMQTGAVLGTAIPASPLGVSWTGEPAEQVYLLLAASADCPGVAVGGWSGALCLDTNSLQVLGPLSPVGPTRVLPLIGALGATAAPVCFEVRLQGGFVNGFDARFGVRCDPLRGH